MVQISTYNMVIFQRKYPYIIKKILTKLGVTYNFPKARHSETINLALVKAWIQFSLQFSSIDNNKMLSSKTGSENQAPDKVLIFLRKAWILFSLCYIQITIYRDKKVFILAWHNHDRVEISGKLIKQISHNFQANNRKDFNPFLKTEDLYIFSSIHYSCIFLRPSFFKYI